MDYGEIQERQITDLTHALNRAAESMESLERAIRGQDEDDGSITIDFFPDTRKIQ